MSSTSRSPGDSPIQGATSIGDSDTGDQAETDQVKEYHEELVDYPGRGEGAPQLYEAWNHPLAPADAERVLFFYMDTTMESMRRMYNYEKGFKVPYCPSDKLQDLGICSSLLLTIFVLNVPRLYSARGPPLPFCRMYTN